MITGYFQNQFDRSLGKMVLFISTNKQNHFQEKNTSFTDGWMDG